MGPSNDRPLTQIDVREGKAGPCPPERLAGGPLFDSLASSLASCSGASSKKGTRSQDGVVDTSARENTVQLRSLGSVTRHPFFLRAAWESPWRKYEKIYDVELGGPAEVAIRKISPVKLVLVRSFSTHAAAETLHLHRQLQHQNIVTALEAFTTDSGLYIALEHMPLSLERMVSSPAYPDERQLAAILGQQVVTGMAYLALEGFKHQSLTCSNILLNTDGDVKIAHQECCHVISESEGTPGFGALSSITMELMQKYENEDGAIDNLQRWPSNSDAVGFLSATTSAASAAELLQHPLLSRPWQKESLIGIISLAQVCMVLQVYAMTRRVWEWATGVIVA